MYASRRTQTHFIVSFLFYFCLITVNRIFNIEKLALGKFSLWNVPLSSVPSILLEYADEVYGKIERNYAPKFFTKMFIEQNGTEHSDIPHLEGLINPLHVIRLSWICADFRISGYNSIVHSKLPPTPKFPNHITPKDDTLLIFRQYGNIRSVTIFYCSIYWHIYTNYLHFLLLNSNMDLYLSYQKYSLKIVAQFYMVICSTQFNCWMLQFTIMQYHIVRNMFFIHTRAIKRISQIVQTSTLY